MTIENNLDEGRIVTLSTSQRDPQLEDRFRIVPGMIYGVTIVGTNPQIRVGYVGRLESVRLHVCSDGFVLDSLELRDGYSRADGRSTRFDREALSLRNERVTAFGFMNEEQFRRNRERAVYENNGE